ncbi:apolipoprotein D-like [Aphidius gifuensis]|uniref:apolipoprotein D-like n=1 Tax=Aphidius gifuensis TaxID=684658 RepID=UPI001CDD7554|nr:apolipoprotein D-like [Aphidius gifuensis]
MILFLLLSVLFAGSLAQVPLSEYPHFEVVRNFDTSKFLGTWYQISRTPNQYEIDQKCSIIGYDWYRNSPLIAYLASTDIKNGEYSRLPASDTEREPYLAQWDFRYPANLKESNGVTSILATDYITYAVKTLVQKAQNGKPGYELIVWILSREKTLSKSCEKTIVDVLNRNRIPLSILSPVDQSNCYIQ